MDKLRFYRETCVSTVLYWVCKLIKFNTEGFQRLPFHFYNAGKIYDWQKREDKFKYVYPSTSYPNPCVWKLIQINREVNGMIKQMGDKRNYDKKEYWATTDEILKRGAGDCEDIAFVKYRKMFEAGFPRDRIGIVCVKGHAFAIYQYRHDDFYILDNGHLTTLVIEASELFNKGDDLRPIVGFNVGGRWSY